MFAALMCTVFSVSIEWVISEADKLSYLELESFFFLFRNVSKAK